MASSALTTWLGDRIDRLDELEGVHGRLEGTGPGRRWLTEQLDRAYLLVLASQFQGYCRDLHSESAAFVARLVPSSLQLIVEGSLTLRRSLDQGNPQASNVASDFARFGIDFWDLMITADKRNEGRRDRLDQLMIWRNSIAHDSRIKQGNLDMIVGTKPTLTWVRRWRNALEQLAIWADRVVGEELASISGRRPW